MSKEDQVLATLSDGTDITVRDCIDYLSKGKKPDLANFIYERLYGRYLKPFDFKSCNYIINYKNGFTLMANSGLLIETYVSFKEAEYKDTKYKSLDCFKYFFTTEPRFTMFSVGEIPTYFYYNVRCGILHNAETRNGWMITRIKNKPIFDASTKTINATKFVNRLKFVLSDYKNLLIGSDFYNDQIWKNFKDRLKFLFENI